MRILLDTHVLLWALAGDDRLGLAAEELLDPATTVYFSAASIWEIAIKASLGRDDFHVDPVEAAHVAVESGFTELPVTASTAARVAQLPWHHRDPFDRLLIAQATSEPAVLITVDRQLSAYSELVRNIRQS